MRHSPGFLALTQEAKSYIKEISIKDVALWQQQQAHFVLIDVRESSEWQKGHLPGAIHLCKGIIERDIELIIPQHNKKLVLYCGGGFRSALAALNLKKMGYAHVFSMEGGFLAWVKAGFEIVLR